MFCPVTKKISYLNKDLAEDALINNHERRHHNPGAGPVNVYQCEHCGDWHFTSKGELNSKLKEAIDSKRIDRSREANYWEGKLR